MSLVGKSVSSGLIISNVKPIAAAALPREAAELRRPSAASASAIASIEPPPPLLPDNSDPDEDDDKPSAAAAAGPSAAFAAAPHSESDSRSRIANYYSTKMYDPSLYKKSVSQDEGEAFLTKFNLEGRYKYEHDKKMFYIKGGDRTAYNKLNILQQLRLNGHKDEESIFFKRKITQQEGDDFLEEYRANDLFMYKEATRSFYFKDNRNKEAYNVILILLYLRNIGRFKS